MVQWNFYTLFTFCEKILQKFLHLWKLRQFHFVPLFAPHPVYHSIAYKILCLMVYFVFKRSLLFFILYRDIVGRCSLIWGSISKTANILWNILGSTYWLQSLRKSDTRNFCSFVYFQSYNGKSKFSILQSVQSSCNTYYLWISHFCTKF